MTYSSAPMVAGNAIPKDIARCLVRGMDSRCMSGDGWAQAHVLGNFIGSTLGTPMTAQLFPFQGETVSLLNLTFSR